MPCRPRGRSAAAAVLGVLVAAGAWGQGAAQAPAPLSGLQADAFVRAVFSARDASRYDAAADAYLGLLASLDADQTPDLEAALLSALGQLAPVVPPAERAEWNLEAALEAASLEALPPGTGARIVGWWNAQDDLPATPTNERLHEHLARVATALESFADGDGYDARGEVYVRLGAPAERSGVEVSPSVIAFDLDLNVPRSWTRVPANEVWTYPHVERGLHYIFVRPSVRAAFRLGTSTDLVPPPLRNAGQGRGRLDAFLVVMEEIYGQLALRDQAYGAVLDEVAGSFAGSAAQARGSFIAQGILSTALEGDVVISGDQARLAPTAFSLTRDGTDDLEAAVRWARFREPDGATRLEVQWGVPSASALRPSRRLTRDLRRDGLEVSDDAWLSVSLAQLDPDGAVGTVAHAHRHLLDLEGGAVTEIVDLEVPSGSAPFALQWQGRLGTAPGSTSRPGTRVKLGTRHLENVVPLPTSGLVVSDLQPLVLEGRALRPYPFAVLPDQGLFLSFEVYGLEAAPDGFAQARVEYRFEGADGTVRDWTGYEVMTDEAVRREQTEIDVAGWAGRAVEVTVRVTDVLAGTSAQRTVSFEVR